MILSRTLYSTFAHQIENYSTPVYTQIHSLHPPYLPLFPTTLLSPSSLLFSAIPSSLVSSRSFSLIFSLAISLLCSTSPLSQSLPPFLPLPPPAPFYLPTTKYKSNPFPLTHIPPSDPQVNLNFSSSLYSNLHQPRRPHPFSLLSRL
jgi:hypothetical protein